MSLNLNIKGQLEGNLVVQCWQSRARICYKVSESGTSYTCFSLRFMSNILVTIPGIKELKVPKVPRVKRNRII